MATDFLLSAFQQTSAIPLGSTSQLVRRIQKATESDLAMQAYLEQVLPISTQLFAAKAGMVWLRALGSSSANFAIRFRMDTIQWEERDYKKHDRILQLAWQQRQPMFVESQERKRGADGKESYHIVFGPIIHNNEPIAMLEYLLIAKPSPSKEDSDQAGTQTSERRSVLRAMQLLMDEIHSGLHKRLSLPQASLSLAEGQLSELEKEIEAYQQAIQRSIENRLRQFQGWSFRSIHEKSSFAKAVQRILDEHGLRVRCPECGNPSILRCSSAGNSKNGIFVFDHYLADGRTFHGGPTTVPAITVVPKPARRVNIEGS